MGTCGGAPGPPQGTPRAPRARGPEGSHTCRLPLKAKHRTFIKMPKELWLDAWRKAGYKNPVCSLVQALYGHPEAGAHWECHLTDVIKEPVPSHPSTAGSQRTG